MKIDDCDFMQDDADPAPTVYFDQMKRTIVNGSPWFPMGMCRLRRTFNFWTITAPNCP